jgi:hypothetical protein
MNAAQKHMLEYMQEVVNQEDVYFFEAWKQVENFVMDALCDSTEQPALENQYEN